MFDFLEIILSIAFEIVYSVIGVAALAYYIILDVFKITENAILSAKKEDTNRSQMLQDSNEETNEEDNNNEYYSNEDYYDNNGKIENSIPKVVIGAKNHKDEEVNTKKGLLGEVLSLRKNKNVPVDKYYEEFFEEVIFK